MAPADGSFASQYLAPFVGCAIGEHFRDEGRDILFFVDNIYRYTLAGVEVSALLGRMPSAVGYQPTLAEEMGTLQERITSTKSGSITSIQAVYVPADDLTDPSPATTFAHLDATVVLSRQIVELGIYPAIDPLESTSRQLDPQVVGEEHYNIISAFIKSMRDSDANGALYWLARMLESGENPRFIARRMIIFASEDIGNADSQAIQVATAISRAVEYVGLPEAQINLAHGVTYLAMAPKSNASYVALLKAKEDAKKGSFSVPLHLRNAVTKLMKKLGYGQDYQYAHDVPNKKPNQTHFPEEIGEQVYFLLKKKK